MTALYRSPAKSSARGDRAKRKRWSPAALVRIARADRSGAADLSGRQIYILPTKYGLILAVLLTLMLVGSLNYGSNLGLLYTFLLTGVGLVTMLHTWRNLVGLRVYGKRADSVFAGQDASFEIELENPWHQTRG